MDDCRDPHTGHITEWAQTIISDLSSYAEVSPSGTGVKITVRGCLARGARHRKQYHGGQVEIYSRERYFTFTGLRIDWAPSTIGDRQEQLSRLHARVFGAVPKANRTLTRSHPATMAISDADLIEKALAARNGSKFRRLWEGDSSEYSSQSEGDMAFCCLLAYWAGNDPVRIDSLFRQSGLMREKWERKDYRHATIEAAIRQVLTGYQPRGGLASGRQPQNPLGDDQKVGFPDLLHYAYTDTGNAERLVRLYGSNIRFCAETKKWLVWDGRRWSFEDSRQVKRLFTKTMREMYKQATEVAVQEHRAVAEKHARKAESAMAISAALKCAEAQDGILTSATELDRDPFLLNVLNGTLDLRNCELREHRRADLIMRMVHFNYRPETPCPQFLRFLSRIMGDSSDSGGSDRANRLVAYLQKCFGYALTGDVSEKAVFCFFGTGNNGKTTLLEIIRHVIAEYSTQVLIESLMTRQSGESSTSLVDLADLRGARYVTTSEVEQGQRLAVGKLKYLTAGMGDVKTCRKYENPITFPATHKLFLDANHKPEIRGAERAVWNRLKPIPFTVVIAPEEIDKQLLEKLKTEAEGILAWLVEGSKRWMEEGLGDPPEVTDASTAWQAESDRFPDFIEERCVVGPGGWVPVAELWPAYQDWCEQNHEKNRLDKTTFDGRLEKLGYHRGTRKDGTVRAWIGIRFRLASDKVTRSDTKCN